jgi:predicted alpha/beta superfamily hydrolase
VSSGRAATLALALTLATGPAHAASLTFVVRPPAGTPPSETLWVSGDAEVLGHWSGSGLALAKGADGLWSGTATFAAGTVVEFKVTRGDWNRVEKDAQGGEIANRRWTVAADDTVPVDVGAWRDAFEKPAAPRPSTRTGDVRTLAAFASKFVPPRDVLVWLPPGYDTQPERRYPVVYFLDGQNVFDGATSFIPGQEWGADEAADQLVRSGRMQPCILVAVPNSAARMDEYTRAADPGHGGGKAALHQRYLLEELKPLVDRTYRTRAGAASTGVVGSSLGGLAALDLLLDHPEAVGMAGCVSPAVWWAGGEIVTRVRAGSGHAGRVWLDIGTDESAPTAGERPWVDAARSLHDALRTRGWHDGGDLHYEEVAGGRHNEAAWRARVDRILEFLVGPAAR